jgi:prepilin-type processing-associated H-X9-DG protein
MPLLTKDWRKVGLVGWTLVVLALISGIAILVQQNAASSAKSESMNNLYQIGLALHNYEALHQSLPPAALISNDGKRLLSWRVLILPEMEERALYAKFHLDEPWDSDHNIRLLGEMPPVYRTSRDRNRQGLTLYRAFVGRGTPLSDGLDLNQIPIHSMFLAIESSDAVPWTQPAEIPYDPAGAVLHYFRNGTNLLMADGSVKQMAKDADSSDESWLRNAITITP